MSKEISKEKTTSLLNCPFCGEEAIIYEDKENSCYMIGCRECCAVEPMTEWCESKENAIAQWNYRKPLERIVERLEILYDEAQDKLSDDFIYYDGFGDGVDMAMRVVKEEGGMND